MSILGTFFGRAGDINLYKNSHENCSALWQNLTRFLSEPQIPNNAAQFMLIAFCDVRTGGKYHNFYEAVRLLRFLEVSLEERLIFADVNEPEFGLHISTLLHRLALLRALKLNPGTGDHRKKVRQQINDMIQSLGLKLITLFSEHLKLYPLVNAANAAKAACALSSATWFIQVLIEQEQVYLSANDHTNIALCFQNCFAYLSGLIEVVEASQDEHITASLQDATTIVLNAFSKLIEVSDSVDHRNDLYGVNVENVQKCFRYMAKLAGLRRATIVNSAQTLHAVARFSLSPETSIVTDKINLDDFIACLERVAFSQADPKAWTNSLAAIAKLADRYPALLEKIMLKRDNSVLACFNQIAEDAEQNGEADTQTCSRALVSIAAINQQWQEINKGRDQKVSLDINPKAISACLYRLLRLEREASGNKIELHLMRGLEALALMARYNFSLLANTNTKAIQSCFEALARRAKNGSIASQAIAMGLLNLSKLLDFDEKFNYELSRQTHPQAIIDCYTSLARFARDQCGEAQHFAAALKALRVILQQCHHIDLNKPGLKESSISCFERLAYLAETERADARHCAAGISSFADLAMMTPLPLNTLAINACLQRTARLARAKKADTRYCTRLLSAIGILATVDPNILRGIERRYIVELRKLLSERHLALHEDDKNLKSNHYLVEMLMGLARVRFHDRLELSENNLRDQQAEKELLQRISLDLLLQENTFDPNIAQSFAQLLIIYNEPVPAALKEKLELIPYKSLFERYELQLKSILQDLAVRYQFNLEIGPFVGFKRVAFLISPTQAAEQQTDANGFMQRRQEHFRGSPRSVKANHTILEFADPDLNSQYEANATEFSKQLLSKSLNEILIEQLPLNTWQTQKANKQRLLVVDRLNRLGILTNEQAHAEWTAATTQEKQHASSDGRNVRHHAC